MPYLESALVAAKAQLDEILSAFVAPVEAAWMQAGIHPSQEPEWNDMPEGFDLDEYDALSAPARNELAGTVDWVIEQWQKFRPTVRPARPPNSSRRERKTPRPVPWCRALASTRRRTARRAAPCVSFGASRLLLDVLRDQFCLLRSRA